MRLWTRVSGMTEASTMSRSSRQMRSAKNLGVTLPNYGLILRAYLRGLLLLLLRFYEPLLGTVASVGVYPCGCSRGRPNNLLPETKKTETRFDVASHNGSGCPCCTQDICRVTCTGFLELVRNHRCIARIFYSTDNLWPRTPIVTQVASDTERRTFSIATGSFQNSPLKSAIVPSCVALC